MKLNVCLGILFRFCCSVTKSCLTLCDPMDCSMPGLPVPHHLPEFAQVHVQCISDAIQPSHPLTPSSPALNLSPHQSCLSVSGNQNTGASASASVLPMSIQGWVPIRLTDLISLLSKRLSRVLSNTPFQKHQFLNSQPSLCSNCHIHTSLLEES